MTKIPRKSTPELHMLQGVEFFATLCKGFTIIAHRWDGWSWHFLLEQTDRKAPEESMKWLYFAAVQADTKVISNSTNLALMVSYSKGQRRNAILRKFSHEVTMGTINKEKHGVI